ncbi:MAG TPA: 30S ribosomal protein S16 [Rubricoccaceae bacterium]|nr:30S ribosomal protein S16 [Rubricoccaceae bacterium]
MSVKLRFRRMGRKKLPVYALVAADARSPRDGRFIEDLGRYEPIAEPARVAINTDRVLYWLRQGAEPSDTVRNLLSEEGVMLRLHLLRKGKTEEEIAGEVERFRQGRADKSAKAKTTKADRRKASLEAERQRAAEMAKQRAEEAKKREAELARQRQEAEAAERAAREAADAEAAAATAAATTGETAEAEAPVAEATDAAAAAENFAESTVNAAEADTDSETAAMAPASFEDEATGVASDDAGQMATDPTGNLTTAPDRPEETSGPITTGAADGAVSDALQGETMEQPGEPQPDEANADTGGEAGTESLTTMASDEAPTATAEAAGATGTASEAGEAGEQAAEQTPASAEGDDLTKLRGIGPKFAELLTSHGISTYAQLAAADTEMLHRLVAESGTAAAAASADTWPEQARLAAAGDWDGLKALIARLKEQG